MTVALRFVNVQVLSPSSIDVTFAENITPNLVPANVSIFSDTINVPDPQVMKVSVSGAVLSITCTPLGELASYFLQFQSTPQNPFVSTNGDTKISEDGVSNKFLIQGPLDPDNPVKQFLTSFLKDNIYNIDTDQTVVSRYVQALSTILVRALYDIRQVKNENYLSFTIVDEQQIRGEAAYDRLNEEAAYEIVRVGLTPTGANATATFQFDSFPYFPVTLQRTFWTESLTLSSTDQPGTFNVNNLTFNLSHSPVTRVNSIVFTLLTPNPVYNYDIVKLGYSLLDSRYDQDFASDYLLLADNQVRLNEAILSDPLFDINNIFKIDVQYEYKDLGRVIDGTTVQLYTTEQSVREVLPPIINIFNLKHAPITDASNNIPTLGGVVFTNPNTNIGAPHPAFLYEIPFRLNGLPFAPGQYAIDYPNGTVYVYGADTTNDGTGPIPPLATYYYQLVYKSEVDYVYDNDLRDLVALPLGSLVNEPGTVVYKYEEVFVPGVDYVSDPHNEVLEERIGNNLVALNALVTTQSPITNVFRIYNETSGEIYTLDRWNDNKVYFRYNAAPRIIADTGERATFQNVTNELLFVANSLTNISSLKVFKINLANNRICSGTEDGLAASFNTSLMFSDGNVFVAEKWFNTLFTESENIDRLLNVGEYTVDYANGVVYCAVDNNQNTSIGSASYKSSFIQTENSHIISVDDLYYRISVLEPKNKTFTYTTFTDNTILPDEFDSVDESFLNGFVGAPYQFFNGNVGAFVEAVFVPSVTNQVKYVRSVYAYDDLVNSTSPLNFAQASTSVGSTISVGTISKQSFESVHFDGANYYVLLNENIPYLSTEVQYTFSVTRVSDSQPLWNANGTVIPGNPLKLILPGINSPQAGDLAVINYSFALIPLARVVVDYNRGDYFVDYTYLADEIIVSYEYGNNALDFRKSTTVPAGTTYYVTYKVGALRDALVSNFGTLVNVPELATLDITLDRERYRDALIAAMTSFIQGPTVAAIKNIGQVISHVEPEIIESAFETWSLGSSLLYPESVETTGSFQLLSAKYGDGVLVDTVGQSITLPINSNLRLEEGTFEQWVIPQWNGLDNDASLTFTILRDGYAISPSFVFMGAGEMHPTASGPFTLDKNSAVQGKPNTNKDGIFIYYDKDISGAFNRWYIEVIDGYVAPNNHTYSIKVTSTGKFYDVKSLTPIKPPNLRTFTGTSSLSLTITGGGRIDQGVTFISDLEHYFLDLGEDVDNSRISLYKDVSGYLNFRVFDNRKTQYSVSADVSGWRINQPHHIAASWKLNTRNNRDEIHLFIDGLEVPNIMKYSQKLQPYLHEKFRTVNPEEIAGLVNRDIVGSDDLTTIQGSNVVSSSITFSAYQIFPGDILYIDEMGFDPTGYTISNVTGQTLHLSEPMPVSVNGNGRFSVNRTSFTITSDIDIAPNIAVTTIHTFTTGTDLAGIAGSPAVTSTGSNFTTLGVKPGYLIRIDEPGLPVAYTIVQVSGNSVTVTDPLPANFSNVTFQVYSNQENEIPGVRALHPDYSISKDNNFNNILTISNGVFAGDLILVRTLGVSSRSVKKQYYVWSQENENVLMTQMPAPISLDEVNITKIIIPNTVIGPKNSTLTGGVFVSNNLPGERTTNAQNGRTVSVTISGTNVDFSTPVTVTLNGLTGIYTVNETITFTDYGTLDFANPYLEVNYIQVNAKPINASKNALAITLREKYSITHSEFSGLVPVVRYSYHIGGGYTLSSTDGYTLTDGYNLFSDSDVGNCLLIHSPPNVAGFYTITGVSPDRHSVLVKSTYAAFQLPLQPFTDGIYQVLNTTAYRSGLQNGFFTLEGNWLPTQAWFLTRGFYELEYSTYTSIKFDPLDSNIYFGTDFEGNNPANAILDQAIVYSIMLTDTRVGETVAVNTRSITKDFNSLKAVKPDHQVLVFIDFDSFPFSNSAPFYTNSTSVKGHFQSSWAVNDNFGASVVMLDKPIVVPNDGIMDNSREGTIEFWMSPLYDTANDPQNRFYFDAFGAVVEEVVSVSNVAVKLSAPAKEIISVKLHSGDQNIDYFVGGKIETDTKNAIQEESVSIGNTHVMVTQPILQVVTVKIAGDLSGTDYFANGTIGTDGRTIYLGRLLPINHAHLVVTYVSTNNKNTQINTQVIRLNRRLPFQNCKVRVTYIPSGLQGDRITVYKDVLGYMNFAITASGQDFVVRAPTRWAKNTWHRVKASYKINGHLGNDEMRLFLDGYQYTDVLFGSGLVFGKYPNVMGSVSIGDGYSLLGSINFKDPINELFIGTDFRGAGAAFTLMDNFRISSISRPIYAPYGEAIDVNWGSNLDILFPVTQDLYTTYLMDFDKLITLNTDFSILTDRGVGSFDFTVNIFDSFGIVSSSSKVKEILEALIKTLKPATSRVFIQYTT